LEEMRMYLEQKESRGHQLSSAWLASARDAMWMRSEAGKDWTRATPRQSVQEVAWTVVVAAGVAEVAEVAVVAEVVEVAEV
jgi:hypothetical protein